jgi:NAD-dependent SIR2 family protein deacetylase
MKKQYKERRIYFHQSCTNCGSKYQSFKRRRIKAGLCRKCRSGVLVTENQIILFDEIKEVDFLMPIPTGLEPKREFIRRIKA